MVVRNPGLVTRVWSDRPHATLKPTAVSTPAPSPAHLIKTGQAMTSSLERVTCLRPLSHLAAHFVQVNTVPSCL